MRRLMGFFAGLMIMVASFAGLYVAAAIFDAGQNHTIDTFFFQPDNSSAMRPGDVSTPAQLGSDVMRDMLMRKYVHEYFYVTPDTENIKKRMRPRSPLAYMSAGAVFKEWVANVAPTIQNLAGAGVLRVVNINDEIYKPDDSDYWIVNYELKTWYRPNDMNEIPEITYGTMYISLHPASKPDEVQGDIGLEKALNEGRGPETIFKFRVKHVELH